MIKTIHTSRLTIRQAQENDYMDLYNIRNNEFVQRYNAMQPPTPDNIKEEINKKEHMYVILKKDSHEIIGEVSYFPDSLRYGVNAVTISYYLGQSYARQGYMYEALHHFLKSLFQETENTLVSARCFAGNQASQNLLIKLGFIHEGELRTAVKGYRDIVHNDRLYSLFETELK